MKNAVRIKGILASSFLFGILSAHANQQSIDQDIPDVFQGSFQTAIEINPAPLSSLQNSAMLTTEDITGIKIISLMRLVPTPEMTEKAERVAALLNAGLAKENDYSEGVESFHTSKTAKDLDMNDVPVLDQGQHGTCVTFASTVVLDALLEKGDFIDQQCSLAHNLFLGKNYWDGANYASQIIEPLQKYGVVEKNNCTETYPAPKLKIKTDDYKNLVNADVTVENVAFTHYNSVTIDHVRKAIDAGRRLTLGFQLKANSDTVSVQGFDVTIDGKKRKGGLWACKQPSSTKNYCGFSISGHEVVIVGYDDEQKLLKIRNSWSAKSGENGDFYMTYEFFDAMSIDATEVWL